MRAHPWKMAGSLLFLAFVVFAYRYSTFRISQNFAEVDPGKFYRSAQLTPQELEDFIKKYGIKTVVSLRGAPEHTEWFQEQKEVLAKNQVEFKIIWWTAEHFPPKDELLRYEEILDKAEYPILVHCRAGSDRTGTATAIYALQKMGQTKDEALAQHLNFSFWHVETFKPAMKEFVRRYQGSAWAKNEYEPCSNENRPWLEHCPDPVSTGAAALASSVSPHRAPLNAGTGDLLRSPAAAVQETIQ